MIPVGERKMSFIIDGELTVSTKFFPSSSDQTPVVIINNAFHNLNVKHKLFSRVVSDGGHVKHD